VKLRRGHLVKLRRGHLVKLRRVAALVTFAAGLSGPSALATPAAVSGDSRSPRFLEPRDPFRPFALAPAHVGVERLPPLQRYDIAQLKLVGVVRGSREARPPRALVEDPAGVGFILTPGTPIGSNGGVVTRIGPRQVVIEEWHTDVIGVRHRNALRLELPRDERRAAQ
jgi:hypothetical protein